MSDDEFTVKAARPDRQARRDQRRAEMVLAAISAIREHGPGVSVAEMAAAAGITKPVLYRHFTDRADLQRAVGEQAAETVLTRIATVLDSGADQEELVRGAIDAFLSFLEDEPQLWRFVVHHPVEQADVVDDAQEQIVRMLALLIGERVRAAGLDSGGAEAWAQGIVGMVHRAGDWWLDRRTMSRAALTDYLTTLIWSGIAGVLAAADQPGAFRLTVQQEEHHG